MTDEQKQGIEAAIALLERECESDYECKSPTCTIHAPECDVMCARAARKQLLSVVDPEVKSIRPNRLTNLAERVFFEHWKMKNERKPWLNGGYTLIEHILCEADGSSAELRRPKRVSHRDMEVATAVIQWLGTNVGGSFLNQCENEIKRQEAERSELVNFILREPTPVQNDLFKRIVGVILKDIIPDPENSAKWVVDKYAMTTLRGEVHRLFSTLFSLYAVETGLVGEAEAVSEYNLKYFRRLRELAKACVQDRVKRKRRLQPAT